MLKKKQKIVHRAMHGILRNKSGDISLSKKEKKKRAVISYGREQTNEWSPFKYSMFS